MGNVEAIGQQPGDVVLGDAHRVRRHLAALIERGAADHLRVQAWRAQQIQHQIAYGLLKIGKSRFGHGSPLLLKHGQGRLLL